MSSQCMFRDADDRLVQLQSQDPAYMPLSPLHAGQDCADHVPATPLLCQKDLRTRPLERHIRICGSWLTLASSSLACCSGRCTGRRARSTAFREMLDSFVSLAIKRNGSSRGLAHSCPRFGESGWVSDRPTCTIWLCIPADRKSCGRYNCMLSGLLLSRFADIAAGSDFERLITWAAGLFGSECETISSRAALPAVSYYMSTFMRSE